MGGKAAERKEKKTRLRLAPIKAGGGGQRVFFSSLSFPLLLRLGLAAAVTDGLCMQMRMERGCLCARAYCRGPHPSAFPGDAARTWEKALAARKTAPCHTEAISAARQPARSQRDQRKQRKTPKKKRAQRNKVERGRGGARKEMIYLILHGRGRQGAKV